MKQFEDREETSTTWVNDTGYTATFRLMLDKKGRAANSVAFRHISLRPNEKITLSSDFDQAIRTEDKFGKVVGGLCPWLKKDGEVEVEMEPCLDFEQVMEEERASKLSVKIQKEKALEEARKVMAQEKVREESEPTNKRGRKASAV